MRAREQILGRLLREVARSFYLTLRVLPRRIRPQIGLAYLLARTTDTVADTELVPVAQRLATLQKLGERIQGEATQPLNFGELARHQGAAAERVLLERCENSLGLLQTLSPGDLRLVREVLKIIIDGQALDLRRFEGASVEHIKTLATATDLDDYTYRVAGCVGEFWTKICRAHLFPRADLDEDRLLVDGVRFGKGLQLINILRDLPVDLRQGRCYLPAEGLAACGLQAADLLDSANDLRMRPLYNSWLEQAEAHVAAGWSYTNTLPWGCVRVRLACAWPLLIGQETLALLRTKNVLDPQHRLKVPRRRVRQLMVRSILYYPMPWAWRRLPGQAGGTS